MKVLKKKLTLMLIPNSMGILKQLNIPVALIYFGAFAVLVLLVGSLFLSAEFFTTKVDQAELERLRAENQRLQEKYDQLRWNLVEVGERYNDLVQKEIRIRNIFDLPEIDSEERMLGIGGPSTENLADMSEFEQDAVATEVEVDRLLRLSRFELEKYGEIETSLLKVRDRLDHTPSIWPTKGWVSRGFGMQYDPFTGYKQMHRGMDIANRTGTPIIATADGKVIQVRTDNMMGRYIVIDHGYGFRTRYGHLSQAKVKVGQRVRRGEVVALMGSTGYSTGPHLHYEVIRNGKFEAPNKFILNDMKS
ncbi:MAG: M23 family metallopeptidase [Candidatus Zixiibacteriota bacterium]|nr:MAG: M23 family metallopeptidase [candidate division Zixibacteria bacterium]